MKKDLVLYNLALDRMLSIEPIEEPFRENPKFDSEKFFDDVIGVSKNIDNRPRTIKFWASREQSKYIPVSYTHLAILCVSLFNCILSWLSFRLLPQEYKRSALYLIGVLSIFILIITICQVRKLYIQYKQDTTI